MGESWILFDQATELDRWHIHKISAQDQEIRCLCVKQIQSLSGAGGLLNMSKSAGQFDFQQDTVRRDTVDDQDMSCHKKT
ncbi:hypothetical protein NBRC116594_07760 [Shimia sp. NS0008-38b]